MTLWATIRYQLEGFHQAPEDLRVEGFLKNLHRHMFHFEVHIEQRQEVDRDVEYVFTKRLLTGETKKILDTMLPTSSCEAIARSIEIVLQNVFPSRRYKVFVSEDLENGTCLESDMN